MNWKDRIYLDVVESEAARLKELSDDELSGLPEFASYEREHRGMTVDFGVWHRAFKGEPQVFVVQAKRDIFWTYGHMFVDGFMLDPKGDRLPLSDEIYWQYA
jgi:hypothetical protein